MKTHLDPRQPSPSPSRPSTSSRSSKSVSERDRRDPEAGHHQELPPSVETSSRRREHSPSHISELLGPSQPLIDPSRTQNRLPTYHGGSTGPVHGRQEGHSNDTLTIARGRSSSQPVSAVLKGLSEGISALNIASLTKRSWNKRIAFTTGREVAERALQPCKLKDAESAISGTPPKRTSGSQQRGPKLQRERRPSQEEKAQCKGEEEVKSKTRSDVETKACVSDGSITAQPKDTDASRQAELQANPSPYTDLVSGEAWSDDQTPVHPPLYAHEEQVIKALDDTDTVLISHGRRAATDSWVLLRSNESPVSTSSETKPPSLVTRSLTAPVISRLVDSSTIIPIISLPRTGSQQTSTPHPSHQTYSNTQQPSRSHFRGSDTLQLPSGPQQGGHGSPDDSGDGSMQSGSEVNAARFTCVYNGTARAEYGNDCHKMHRYVSQLKRHHERHDLFYCSKCFSLFATKLELERHEEQDSCQSVCLSATGHPPGVPKTRGCKKHRATQEEQYQWLRRLALEHIPDNGATDPVEHAVADAPIELSTVQGSQHSHDELYEPSDAPISMNSSYQFQLQEPTTDLIEIALEVYQLASVLSPRLAHLTIQDQATIRSAEAHLNVIRNQLRHIRQPAVSESRTAAQIPPDAYVEEMETYPTRRAQASSLDQLERSDQFGHSHNLPFPAFSMAPTSVSHAQAQGIMFQDPQGHDGGNTNWAGHHPSNQSSWIAEPDFDQSMSNMRM